MQTITITEDILFAVTEDGRKHRVSEPRDWNGAIDLWYRFDDRRFKEAQPASIDGVKVEFYAVRSETDPEWPASAPIATVTEHTLTPSHLRTRGGEPLKAVREWAQAQGFEGRAGGWIYNEAGESVAQGWASFIHTNFNRLRRNDKVQAAALAHHFGVSKPGPVKLPRRQAETLVILFKNGAGAHSIRPGYMPEFRGWDTVDLIAPGKALEKKGLLTMGGVAYGPKTYKLTREGIRVAKGLIAQENN